MKKPSFASQYWLFDGYKMKKYLTLRAIVWAVLLFGIVLFSFLAYLQPAFILDLANRYVLC